jgi:hypothetical protein
LVNSLCGPTHSLRRRWSYAPLEEVVVRVYFHLKDAHEVLLDVEGVEVTDLHEVRAQAAMAIEELRSDDVQYWSGWTLTAVDAAGRILFSVDLATNVWSERV